VPGSGSIGLDVGGTKILGVLLDSEANVLCADKVPTPLDGDELIFQLAAVANDLAVRGSEEFDLQATMVGVGVPGLVDSEGVLRFAPNLPGVVGLEVKARLSRELPDMGVFAANDASCAAWGERRIGAAKGRGDTVMVTLGTGIGGGIIADDRLILGENGFSGEIGHMVIDPNGPPCPCGKRGCWERYASGSGLGRLAREAAVAGKAARVVQLAGGDPEAVRGEHVTRACAENDPGAIRLMQDFAWWLALGLANLANVLDPACFVLGGGLIASGEVLMGAARAAFADLVEAVEHRTPIDILPAALGERAGAIGAGLLAVVGEY
jgi:glucokinase